MALESSIDQVLFPENDQSDPKVNYATGSVIRAPSRISTLNSSHNAKDMIAVMSSWKMKLPILLCMLSLPVGCHYIEATVGTLKTTLKHAMHINNTQFSILLSSVTLVNTVLPLVAGFFVDDITSLGSIRATTLVSLIILVGSLLVSIGASINSYPCMMTGQIVYGLGGGMIVTMQEGILSRWFRDKQLTIIIGVMLCLARLTKWVAKMVTYPIVNSTGSHAWPLYVATIFCASGVVMNFVYWFVMWRNGCATIYGKEIVQFQGAYHNQFENEKQGEQGEKRTESNLTTNSIPTRYQSKKASFKWTFSLLFYIPSTYWMIPLIQLVMSSVLSSFDDVATEYVEFRYNTTSIMAGYQSSLTQVVPIIGAPILGILVHKYGYRLYSLLFGAILLTVSMVLLAYTWVTPAVGMIIFSFALALGPVSVLSSSALLLPHELAGTGMGLHKCANNIGTTIVSVIVGYVQDLTYHDGNPHDDITDLQEEYDGVMIFYMSLAGCSILAAVLFMVIDRKKLSGWLQANRVERQRRLDLVQTKEEEEKTKYFDGDKEAIQALHEEKMSALKMIGSRLRTKKAYTYVFLYSFWLVVSWAIFFTFALMPVYQSYM